MMKPFLDLLGLISAYFQVRPHYRKMPVLASLNAKNRSKSPFSIGELFSIISEFTVDHALDLFGVRGKCLCTWPPVAATLHARAGHDSDASCRRRHHHHHNNNKNNKNNTRRRPHPPATYTTGHHCSRW